MHRPEAADVIAAKLLGATLKRLARAKAHELLKRRIKIGLAPDEKIEPLDDHRRECELELPRARLDSETHIGPVGGDGEGEIRLRPLDGLDALEIGRLEAPPASAARRGPVRWRPPADGPEIASRARRRANRLTGQDRGGRPAPSPASPIRSARRVDRQKTRRPPRHSTHRRRGPGICRPTARQPSAAAHRSPSSAPSSNAAMPERDSRNAQSSKGSWPPAMTRGRFGAGERSPRPGLAPPPLVTIHSSISARGNSNLPVTRRTGSAPSPANS